LELYESKDFVCPDFKGQLFFVMGYHNIPF
jgi:hypothetical protein